MPKRNIYTHDIDLEPLRIENAPPRDFARSIERIPFRGYEVEEISDGRRIVIAKPGGKQNFGKIRKEDFFVFIFDPKENTLWQISHQQIYEDLLEKSRINKQQTVGVLRALERVYLGEEPDTVLKTVNVDNSIGETAEVLLKAYKWIWGQEDVNYPTGKGRAMSWEGWAKQDGNMVKTGTGLKDLLAELQP